MNPILDSDKAKVYYDGIFSNPRLQHPEGSLWMMKVMCIVEQKMEK